MGGMNLHLHTRRLLFTCAAISPLLLFLPSAAGRSADALHKGASDLTPSSRARVKTRVTPGAVLDLGPLLGHIGPNDARIWAQASSQADLSVRIGLQADLAQGHVQRFGVRSERAFARVQLQCQPRSCQPIPQLMSQPRAELAQRLEPLAATHLLFVASQLLDHAVD